MIRDTVKISIIETEGLQVDPCLLGCYVSLDGRLQDVVTPLASENEDNTVPISSCGTLQLMVKAMGEQTDKVDSVSVFTGLLQPGESYWLPLDGQSYEDFLPSETPSKKILVSVGDSDVLSPVAETVEYSEIEADSLCQKAEFNDSNVESEVERLKNLLEVEQRVNGLKMEKYRERETSLSTLIQEKESQIRNLQDLLEESQAHVQHLDYQNAQLKCLLDSYKNQVNAAGNYKTEIDALKQKLEETETQNRKLIQDMSKNKLKDLKLKDVNTKRTESRSLTPKISKSDETEVALKEFLQKRNLEKLFVRESPNIYNIQKKKVYIVLKNGILLCRTGGGFMNIEKFIDTLDLKNENTEPKTVRELRVRRNSSKSPLCESNSAKRVEKKAPFR